MRKKIVILEDNPDRCHAIQACLADRLYTYEPCFFDKPKEMIDFLETHLEEAIAISLDHDLELIPNRNGSTSDPGTGREVAEYLAGRDPVCPVIIHSTNTTAAAYMEMILQEVGWQTHRVVPYGDLEWISGPWLHTVRKAIFWR